MDTRSIPGDRWRVARAARAAARIRRPAVVRGLGRRVMAVSELPQPGRFRPGQHVIHHSVHVGQMPAGGQHCGQVVGWHVALLSQSIQNAQHSLLGEVGPAGGRRHQVNQLRQTLTVSGGALAMTAAEPTRAVSTISAMAHRGLPGEAVSRVKLEPMTGHGEAEVTVQSWWVELGESGFPDAGAGGGGCVIHKAWKPKSTGAPPTALLSSPSSSSCGPPFWSCSG